MNNPDKPSLPVPDGAEPVKNDLLSQMQALIDHVQPDEDRTQDQIQNDQDETYAMVADVLNTTGKPLIKKYHILDAERLARKPGEIKLMQRVRGKGDGLRGPRFELHYSRIFPVTRIVNRETKTFDTEETGVIMSWRPDAAFRKDTDDHKRAAVRFSVACEVLSGVMQAAAGTDAEGNDVDA